MQFNYNKGLVTLTCILIVNAFEDYDLWSTTFSFIVVEYVKQMIKAVMTWNFFVLCFKKCTLNDNFQTIRLLEYCFTKHKKTK